MLPMREFGIRPGMLRGRAIFPPSGGEAIDPDGESRIPDERGDRPSGSACDPTNAGALPRWVSPTPRMQRPTFPWPPPVDPLTIVKGRRMLGGIGRCRAWRRPRGGGGPWRRRRSAVGGRLRGASARAAAPARQPAVAVAARSDGVHGRRRSGGTATSSASGWARCCSTWSRIPDHVRRVLLDNARNYPRSSFYDRTKVVVGEGLVTTEGAPGAGCVGCRSRPSTTSGSPPWPA